MLYKRSQLYKRKIIGGSLLGNLFSSVTKIAATAAKTVLKNASQQASNSLKTSNVKGLQTSKVKDSVKNITQDQFGVSTLADAKKLAAARFQAAAMERQLSLAVILHRRQSQKLIDQSFFLPAVKDSINQMDISPKVKKLLKKSKDLLGNFKLIINQPVAPLSLTLRGQ